MSLFAGLRAPPASPRMDVDSQPPLLDHHHLQSSQIDRIATQQQRRKHININDNALQKPLEMSIK